MAKALLCFEAIALLRLSWPAVDAGLGPSQDRALEPGDTVILSDMSRWDSFDRIRLQ